MGVVKLELAHSKNYCLVIPTGPRKGVAQSFKEGKEYMVDEATAEILLAKTDPNGNDVFRLVLDEPEDEAEDAGTVSLVEKKTKEAKLKKAATAKRKKARKKAKGKKIDPKKMEVSEVGPSKRKPAEEGISVEASDLEDANEGIPDGIEV